VPPHQDRYGADVLGTDWRAPNNGRAVEHEARKGLVVEEVETNMCGEIVAVERDLRTVTLEDRRGRRRTFPLGPGFLLEGRPVVLVPPSRGGPSAPTRTASGSRAVADAPARVARASRIYVEGRHDAELVEKVWGDDLRVEGVVVGFENHSGKTTLGRSIAAKALDAGRTVAYLDADLGQKAVGPPTTVSLRVLRTQDDIRSEAMALPDALYFVGSTTPQGQLLPLVVGAGRLLEKSVELGADDRDLVVLIPLPDAPPVSLFDVGRPPWAVEVVQRYRPGLDVGADAHPLGRADQDADRRGGARGDRSP